MNPAGGVHCTIGDFARYAREHLRGLEGRGDLLLQSSYQTLHSVHLRPKANEFYQGSTRRYRISIGYGWGLSESRGSTVSYADGSGGTFYARLVVAPDAGVAMAGFTNSGTGVAALDKMVRRLRLF